MHIWVGIDLDSQLTDVRERASAVERELGLACSCYTLPMHVSLKMPFEMEGSVGDAASLDGAGCGGSSGAGCGGSFVAERVSSAAEPYWICDGGRAVRGRAAAVVRELAAYFAAQTPFSICPLGVENEGGILWIRMERSDRLDRLHDELNGMLAERYGVGLHEYDTDYKFHTTLFMDSDPDMIAEAEARLGSVELPRELRVSRFVIGSSETGALGTYSVLKTVCIE